MKINDEEPDPRPAEVVDEKKDGWCSAPIRAELYMVWRLMMTALLFLLIQTVKQRGMV